MKKLSLLLSFLILTAAIPGPLSAGQPALIKVDLDRTISAIDPNIYGSFLEPLSRGDRPDIVYGPLYDPASPRSDENGFCKEYVQQIKDLKVTAIRWPGGNFVSGYNWQDGIGPKAQRPVTFTGKGQAHLVNAEALDATNTAKEEKVRTVTSDLAFTGNRISHTFPAHSFTQLEIVLQK